MDTNRWIQIDGPSNRYSTHGSIQLFVPLELIITTIHEGDLEPGGQNTHFLDTAKPTPSFNEPTG